MAGRAVVENVSQARARQTRSRTKQLTAAQQQAGKVAGDRDQDRNLDIDEDQYIGNDIQDAER
jgi:hypothetical protein